MVIFQFPTCFNGVLKQTNLHWKLGGLEFPGLLYTFLKNNDTQWTMAGWWFGICSVFFHMFPYCSIICFHMFPITIPTDFHFFQRGFSTTNQMRMKGNRPRLWFGRGRWRCGDSVSDKNNSGTFLAPLEKHPLDISLINNKSPYVYKVLLFHSCFLVWFYFFSVSFNC